MTTERVDKATSKALQPLISLISTGSRSFQLINGIQFNHQIHPNSTNKTFHPIFFFVKFHQTGAGCGQLVGIFLLATYYASIMALVGRYLYDSFQTPLPWTTCQSDWVNCIDPSGNTVRGNFIDEIRSNSIVNSTHMISSSEYHFM